MTHKSAAIAALFACIAVSPNAYATASASASLTGFSMSFTELGNGWFYSPPIVWIDDDGSALNYAVARTDHSEDGAHVQTQYRLDSTPGLFDPVGAATLPTDNSTLASASISGDGRYEDLSLSVAGSAGSGGPQAGARDSFIASTYRYYSHHDPYANFLLRPYTEVEFSVWSSVAVQTTGGPSEAAYASAGLYVTSLFGSLDPSFQSSSASYRACSDYLNETDVMTCDAVGHNVSTLRRLSVRFSNPGGTVLSGRLYASAGVEGFVETTTPAVPEPQDYALLLAGLGVVGIVSRRRVARS